MTNPEPGKALFNGDKVQMTMTFAKNEADGFTLADFMRTAFYTYCIGMRISSRKAQKEMLSELVRSMLEEIDENFNNRG